MISDVLLDRAVRALLRPGTRWDVELRLRVAPATARAAVHALAREGRIRVVGREQAEATGRPRKIWAAA